MTGPRKIGICVLSFDGACDLWRPFFDHFYAAWPECPYTVYLVSNHRTYEGQATVTTLSIGEDVNWSSNLRLALRRIPEDRVLFIFDDFLPRSINVELAEYHIGQAIDNDWPYLTLYPNNYRTKRVAPGVSRIAERGIYRCTLLYGLFRKDVLMDLLVDGEDAWEFELESGKRARNVPLYSVDRPVFKHFHLLRKGVWMRPGYRYLRACKYEIDQQRPVESVVTFFIREGKEFLFRLYHKLIPPRVIERLERRRRKAN